VIVNGARGIISVRMSSGRQVSLVSAFDPLLFFFLAVSSFLRNIDGKAVVQVRTRVFIVLFVVSMLVESSCRSGRLLFLELVACSISSRRIVR
jgi:hypothetical protein